MIDDLLIQEIQSLREKIKILTKIVSYYEPEIEMIGFLHDIGVCDYQEYMQDKTDAEEWNYIHIKE